MFNVRLFSIGLLTALMLTMGMSNANAEEMMDTSATVRMQRTEPLTPKKQNFLGRLFNGTSDTAKATGNYAKDSTVGTSKAGGGGVVGVGKAAGGVVTGTGRAVLGMSEADSNKAGAMNEQYSGEHGFKQLAMDWEQKLKLTAKQRTDLNTLKMTYDKETSPMEMDVDKMKKELYDFMASSTLRQDKITVMIDELSDAKRDLMKKRVNFYFQVEKILTPTQVTQSRAFWGNHMKQAQVMHDKQVMMEHQNQSDVYMKNNGRSMMPEDMNHDHDHDEDHSE